MTVDPTPEHRWLARLLGDWTWTHESTPEDERTLRGYFQNADGTWTHFMTTRYRRVG